MSGRYTALLLLICTLWASVGIAIKLCLTDAPPIGLAALRMLLSAAALGLWQLGRARPVLSRARWRPVAITVVCYCSLLIFTHLGFKYTSAARGIVFLNTTPLFVAVLANFIAPREPLRLLTGFGLLLAIAGLLAIFGPSFDANRPLLGDGLMMVAAVSWAFHTLWTKRAAQDVDPKTLMLLQFIGAAVVLSVISLGSEPLDLWRITPKLVAGAGYLSIAGTVVAWLLWVRVLRSTPAGTASSFIFLVPVIGMVMSWLVLHEAITRQFVVGTSLICAGIIMVNRRGKNLSAAGASPLSAKPCRAIASDRRIKNDPLPREFAEL